MNSLFEEYNRYVELNKLKSDINDRLVSMSGHNDSDTLDNVNKLGREISDINNELGKYNTDSINKIEEYYKIKSSFDRLCEEIKIIEKLSLKSRNEKVILNSSEGRKKEIDKDFMEEYKLLADSKRSLRSKFVKSYNDIRNINIFTPRSEEASSVRDNSNMEVKHELSSYDELSIQDKITHLEERLGRIFSSSYLPNQGKKMLVTYNGEKKSIPVKYNGRYVETLKELNSLRSKVPVRYTIEEVADKRMEPSIKMVDMMERLSRRDVILHPVKVTFRDTPRINVSRAKVTKVKKEVIEKLKKALPKVWNIDMKSTLAILNAEKKILDGAIVIKSSSVKLAEEAIAKYDSTKAKIVTTSREGVQKFKNVIKKVQDRAVEIKNIYNMQKDVGLKEAMERVYTTKKEDYIDYQIVNRVVNFKSDMCQRVSESRGKICEVTRAIRDRIKMPFDKLRESAINDAKRAELKMAVEQAKLDIAKRQRDLSKIKVRSLSGYVGVGFLTVMLVVIVGALIFTTVRYMVGH